MRWLRRVGIALATVVVVVLAASGAYLAWDDLAPARVAVDVPGATVDAAGVSTHVEHWPALRPSGRPPLVLVPGFAESTYVFSRLAPRLAADREVYAYDVRGHGFTAHVPPYDLTADTDQLAGLIGALHLTRPVVLGHSSGVAIALSLALRDPASLSGVVAANGDGTPYFGADRTIPGGGGGLRTLLTLPPVGPAVVTAIVRHRGPALDTSFDADDAAAMAELVRTPLVAGLPGARHLALLGEPERFAATVTPLLDRLG